MVVYLYLYTHIIIYKILVFLNLYYIFIIPLGKMKSPKHMSLFLVSKSVQLEY